MYTAGVVFATLAGLQVLFLLMRGGGGFAIRTALRHSDTPFLRHELSTEREQLQTKLGELEKTSTRGPKIMSLVYLAVAALFFYFQ